MYLTSAAMILQPFGVFTPSVRARRTLWSRELSNSSYHIHRLIFHRKRPLSDRSRGRRSHGLRPGAEECCVFYRLFLHSRKTRWLEQGHSTEAVSLRVECCCWGGVHGPGKSVSWLESRIESPKEHSQSLLPHRSIVCVAMHK